MRPKSAVRLCAIVVFVLFLLRLTGLTMYLYERSYETEFAYGPPDDDVRRAIATALRSERGHQSIDDTDDLRRPRLPTSSSVELRIDSGQRCRDGLGRAFESSIRLVVVIKSALEHFANRRAIRKTWGWEERFSDVIIRRVFLIALPRPFDDPDLQSRIDAEQEKYLDLVQGEFVDNYFNNTLKTLVGLEWVTRYCPTAEYALFADDDYYVSIKNVLRFLRRPSSYPEYLKRALMSIPSKLSHNNLVPIKSSRKNLTAPAIRRQWDDDEDEIAPFDSDSNGGDAIDMYVGYRFFSKPHRWKLSKFFVSVDEYEYDRFPPYITAGAYLMSHTTVLTLHYASLYVPSFRFDDVYLGILAKKAGIRPVHNENFYFYRPSDLSTETFAYLIATHGFSDPKELETVWNEQRAIGNA